MPDIVVTVDSGGSVPDEYIEDVVDRLLEADDKLTWTYDDGNNTLTISTTALDAEEVRDTVGNTLTGGRTSQ